MEKIGQCQIFAIKKQKFDIVFEFGADQGKYLKIQNNCSNFALITSILFTFFYLNIFQYDARSQSKRAACLHKTGNLSFLIPSGELPADLNRMGGFTA